MAGFLEFPRRLRQHLDGLLALADAARARFHARRAVQQDDDGVRRGRKRPTDPAARQGPRQEQNERGHCKDAAGQEEELAQLGVRGRTARGREQEPHGRPRFGAMPQAIEQVDEDRGKHQRQTQQHVWLQKRHGLNVAGHLPCAPIDATPPARRARPGNPPAPSRNPRRSRPAGNRRRIRGSRTAALRETARSAADTPREFRPAR